MSVFCCSGRFRAVGALDLFHARMNRLRRVRCVPVHVDLCFIEVRSFRFSRLLHVDLSFVALALVGSSLSLSLLIIILFCTTNNATPLIIILTIPMRFIL
jgi:hypothetical protein